MQTIVSVLMITYNHADFIKEAINGVLMQETNFNYELIIGDDCSFDSTGSKIENIIKNHTKGKIIDYKRNENNLGMQSNYTNTFNRCSGNYIAVCEGDDYWTDPYKLQKQVDFLEANEDYAICFHKVMLKIGDKIEDDFLTNPPIEDATIKNLIEIGNFIHTPSVVFRNKLKKFPIQFNYSPVGDYFLYILLTDDGSKIKFINETMAVYRYGVGIHSTKNSLEKHWDWYEMLVLIKSCSLNHIQIINKKIDSFREIVKNELINSLTINELSYKFKFTDLIKIILSRLKTKFRF